MSYIGGDLIINKPIYRFNFRMMGGKGLRKNLATAFEDEPDSPSDDAIKVFLRLKPSTNENETTIQLLDSKTLQFKMPPKLVQSRKKLNMPDQYKYTFSNIFRSDVTQSEIFTGCVVNHIKDLFSGQHCLLFTYGTTNAGKTYTVLGTGEQPGIIPRTLTTVFKSIRGKQYENARIMPHMFNSAVEVTDETLEEELNFKKWLLTWNPADKTQSDSSRLCKSQASTVITQSSFDDVIGEVVFQQMQKRLTNDTTIVEYEAEPEDRFSVWVSFAEIYNEAIYDLLHPMPSINLKRKPLKLARDSNKNTYIKGLKHIFVQSEEEAYKVLRFGKNNLQVAATSMNSSSSRSHCIFSIKLMKCANVERPERVVVSSFSICDLAGAERQKKTLNLGLRLKESQNINCSLHVLSRCFSIIRENQLNNEHKLIPFRDSKLTQLFQHALLGKESVTMIVNVNSEQHLCEETEHVLRASAIAKHIVVQPRVAKPPQRTTRSSMFFQICKQNRGTMLRWDSCVRPKASDALYLEGGNETESTENEPTLLEQKQEQYENILSLVESLKDKLKEEKAKHLETKKTFKNREDEIREEMREELKHTLEQAKKQNALDIKRTQEIREEAGNKRKERVISGEHVPSKKPLLDTNKEEGNKSVLSEVGELEDEVKIQQKEIDGLIDLVNIIREEKNELTMELTHAKIQLGWKDREIRNLKEKIQMFGEESDVNAAYMRLEKEMEEKLKVRDFLLEEARYELLDELAAREEHEEEIAKLEKELTEKETEIATLRSEIEDTKKEVVVKTYSMDMMESHIEEMEMNFNEEIQALERKCCLLEEELAAKNNDEIRKLNLQTVKHIEELDSEEKQLINLQSEIDKLVCEKATMAEDIMQQTELKESLKSARTEIFQLQQALADKCAKNQELEEFVNSNEKRIDEDHYSQISVLEQSLKQQLQETTRLWSVVKEKESQNNQLCKELAKGKATVDELKLMLRDKEHELECCQNKVMGYENSVPALQAEFVRQQREMAEYKLRCEDQKETIINMEQEINSFQTNQKEIVGKYEEQLKKTKEEIEMLKKEVAKVTNAFYQSTPTPKKHLEKQIEELTKQMNELRSNNQKLQKEREVVRNKEKIYQKNKENSYEAKNPVTTSEGAVKAIENQLYSPCTETAHHRAGFLSTGCEMGSPTRTQLGAKESRITYQLRGRRLASDIPVVQQIAISEKAETSEKPQKQIRKKLWQASSQEDISFKASNQDEQDDNNIIQDSPVTIVKRKLRNRKE